MVPASAADLSTRYDSTSMRLHWITALLVIALWCLGETIDWFPRGEPRIAARSLHIVFGALLTMIVCWRIWWRAGPGRRLPAAEMGALRMLASAIHFALYAVLVATLVLGIVNTLVRGDSIFGVFALPSIAPGNRALRGQIEDLHSWCANALVILAGVHAAAALWHHYVRKDGVLLRMLPARSR
jgi:cytochrome b561